MIVREKPRVYSADWIQADNPIEEITLWGNRPKPTEGDGARSIGWTNPGGVKSQPPGLFVFEGELLVRLDIGFEVVTAALARSRFDFPMETV